MSSSIPNPASVIVVLGGSNDKSGKLSQMSLDRCDQVLIAHEKHPQCRILTTGGWGTHFNQSAVSHGELMKRELVRRGIAATQFFPIAISAYTEADASSAKLILSPASIPRILLITSDFHMDRAEHYFKKYFPETEIRPCPAKSTLPREELAQRIVHEKKRMAEILESPEASTNSGS